MAVKSQPAASGQSESSWRRLAGRGMYPAEYAGLLLNPLRHLIAPPGRIADRLKLAATDRVLEAGCGPGFFSPTIAARVPAGRLTLFDAQQPMLALARARMAQHGAVNFACVQGDAQRLPFGGETFDVVFMVTVLGEVSDPSAALVEAARVLRPHGRLSLTEAAGDPDRMKPSELDQLATQAGLLQGERWSGLLVKTCNYRKRPTG